MKKALCSILLVCSLGSASASDSIQANNNWVEQEEQRTFINSVTPNHTKMKNFDYAVVLPNTGYKQNSAGFKTSFTNEDDDATITVMQSDIKFNKETGKKITINEKEAYLLGQKKLQQYKLTLVYYEKPEPNYPIVIYGECNINDERTINKLESCLLSVVYTGPKQKVGKTYENSLFSIENGGFKQQHMGTMMVIFTPSGDVEKEKANKNSVYFQVQRLDGAITGNKQKKNANKLVNDAISAKQKSGKAKKVTINGLNGFEFDVLSKDKKGALEGYATVLYTDKGHYFFMSESKSDDQITAFKQIARTLKIK